MVARLLGLVQLVVVDLLVMVVVAVFIVCLYIDGMECGISMGER